MENFPLAIIDQLSEEGMSMIIGGDAPPTDTTIGKINNGSVCDVIDNGTNCNVINNGSACSTINNKVNCAVINNKTTCK